MVHNKKNNLALWFLIPILSLYSLICLADSSQPINYLHDPNRIEWTAGGFYEGHFSDGTPFQMTLIYEPPKKLHQYHDLDRPLAWYQYSLDLSGNKTAMNNVQFHQNHFKLSDAMPETVFNSADNDLNEVFNGTLSSDKHFAQGDWTQTKGLHKKTLHFSMHRVLPYHGIFVSHPIPMPEGADLEEQEQFRDVNRPFEFSAIFPKLKSQLVNRLITQDSSACDYDQECGNIISISYQSKNRLSVIGEFYGYGIGEAHGYWYHKMRNFIASSHGMRELSLNDFMSKSLTCRKRLANLIVPELDDPDTDWHEFVADQLLPQKALFFPTTKGIVFDFGQIHGTTSQDSVVFISKKQFGQCLVKLPSD